MQTNLADIAAYLDSLGFVLEREQPHLGGERYLMQAVTTHSGKKMVLLGHRKSDGARIVIKVSDENAGMRELVHERECRDVLNRIRFAYGTFLSPQEIFFGHRGPYLIAIQEFIEAKPFLDHPLEEQFALALKAFKAQESAHATTYKHIRLIEHTFGSKDSAAYVQLFADFGAPHEALHFLEQHRQTVEQYCGFLTHTDFVPHNIRVVGHDIYLLDHSSLRFGNKYDGWARFINFMELYNPQLARWLVQYVRDNRTQEESVALKCMRIYRLGEIVHYYRGTLARSEGDLKRLNQARIEFWGTVLDYVLRDVAIPRTVIEKYKQTRDALRSDEEKRRQVGLH